MVGAVEILRGSWRLVEGRTGTLARYASRGHHFVVPGGVEARIGRRDRMVPNVVVGGAYYADLLTRRGYLDAQLAVDELGLGTCLGPRA